MAVPVVSVAPARTKFSGLAWTALVLGTVGLVGAPVIIFDNPTAIAAGVGVVLGLIAISAAGRCWPESAPPRPATRWPWPAPRPWRPRAPGRGHGESLTEVG
jgi:uncharacterized membrane protein YccC